MSLFYAASEVLSVDEMHKYDRLHQYHGVTALFLSLNSQHKPQ